MKKVYNYWMPDTDTHFERMITKRVRNGGPAEYQDDVRDEAYKHVTDFNICLDIGANIGLYTRGLAARFEFVHAFEPMQQVLECLKLNIPNDNVVIHEFGLGSKETTVDFVYNKENTGATFVNESTLGNGSIPLKQLDSLKFEKMGLIKIDCERYELEILRGSVETLLTYKPIIIVEQHPDTEYCAGKFLRKIGARYITNVRKDYIFGW